MTLRRASKSPSLPTEELWSISSSLGDTSPPRQSVHAAGMSDRLPFGRITSTSSAPRRLMEWITLRVLAFEGVSPPDDGHLGRNISAMGSVAPLPSTPSRTSA